MSKKTAASTAIIVEGDATLKHRQRRETPAASRRRRNRFLARGFVHIGDQTIICESMTEWKAIKAELGIEKAS